MFTCPFRSYILVLTNLLVHNNWSQICYCGQISLQSAAVNCSFSDNLTPLKVTYILLEVVRTCMQRQSSRFCMPPLTNCVIMLRYLKGISREKNFMVRLIPSNLWRGKFFPLTFLAKLLIRKNNFLLSELYRQLLSGFWLLLLDNWQQNMAKNNVKITIFSLKRRKKKNDLKLIEMKSLRLHNENMQCRNLLFIYSTFYGFINWFMREWLTGVGLLCMDTLSCIHGVGR